MKSSKLLLTAMLFCLTICLTGCVDKVIPPAEAPTQITDFVSKHFPTQAITFIKKDTEVIGTTYEVTLPNGTEIDFDSDYIWDKVDCKIAAVPAVLVPEAIATQVQTNYPGALIVKIDKERYGFDIELNNNLDLKFNPQGAIIEVDN